MTEKKTLSEAGYGNFTIDQKEIRHFHSYVNKIMNLVELAKVDDIVKSDILEDLHNQIAYFNNKQYNKNIAKAVLAKYVKAELLDKELAKI